jgi:hypothetical protein
MKTTEIHNVLRRAEENREHVEKTADEIREKRFKELFEEYEKQYPKLMQLPAWRQMLIQCVRLYMEIERMWSILDNLWYIDNNGRTEYRKMFKEIRETIRDWELTLTRMGTTFTSQNYIPVKDRDVQAASEIARMHERVEKIKVNMKKMEKGKARLNPGGRRETKYNDLATQKNNEMEKESSNDS